MRPRSTKAYTLLEVSIASAMLVMILWSASAMFQGATNSLETTVERSKLLIDVARDRSEIQSLLGRAGRTTLQAKTDAGSELFQFMAEDVEYDNIAFRTVSGVNSEGPLYEPLPQDDPHHIEFRIPSGSIRPRRSLVDLRRPGALADRRSPEGQLPAHRNENPHGPRTAGDGRRDPRFFHRLDAQLLREDPASEASPTTPDLPLQRRDCPAPVGTAPESHPAHLTQPGTRFLGHPDPEQRHSTHPAGRLDPVRTRSAAARGGTGRRSGGRVGPRHLRDSRSHVPAGGRPGLPRPVRARPERRHGAHPHPLLVRRPDRQ